MTDYPHLKAFNRSQLRAGQLRMLDILLAIDALCKQHNLAYWIDNGTLLGAVRHGGFIPWDDDMDIAMPADDFEKFAALAPKNLPEGLAFQPGRDAKGRIYALPKVRDLNSFYAEAHDDLSLSTPRGLFVDITPFAGFPAKHAGLARRIARGWSVSSDILHKRHYYSLRSFAEFFYFSAKRIWCRILWNVLSCTAGRGERTAPLNPLNGYGLSHRLDAIWPLTPIEFEGHKLPAPAKPDDYLTEIYGNWRELPPVEKRKVHAVFMVPQLAMPEK